MADSVLPKVVAAVELLYTAAAEDPKKRREANSWLCEFRQQPEAWNVAAELLENPSSSHTLQFFAAQTLHLKLRHDFDELPEAQVVALKTTLLAHLVKALSVKNTPVVNTLRLAIATIAVQTNWQTFADDILQGVPSIAPDAGAYTAEKTLLFVVEVIPDECRSDRLEIDSRKRRAFADALDGMALKVLDFISKLAPVEGMAALVNPVLRCLSSWVQHCRVPAAALTQSPLFYSTFDALAGAPGYEESFDVACDAAVGIMRTYEATNPDSLPVIKEMVPRIMSLAEGLRSSRDQDPDRFRGFVILFTEMGEAFMDFLLSEEDVGQMAVLEILLECTAYEDPEVARTPLQFWYRMRCRIGEFDHVLQDRLTWTFAPVFSKLLQILLPLAKHPSDASDYFADSFDMMRECVADALDDCCMMIGAQEVLDSILGVLSEQMGYIFTLSPAQQLESWQAVESCLFSITCIRKWIAVKNTPGFAELVAALPQLPPVDALRVSSYRVIGYFADVFELRPDLLEPSFQFLLAGITNQATASHALRDVCKDNAAQLGEPILGLYDSLDHAGLDAVDENAILQGLSSVMSTLPAGKCDNFLHHMMEMPMQRLNQAAAGDSAPNVSRELDKLATLMKFTRPREVQGVSPAEHPIVRALQRLWPTISAVLSRFQATFSIVERACRIVKHALRSAPRFMTPETIKFVIEQMVTFFHAYPQSAYLYVTSISVADFSADEQNATVFYEALVHLSSKVSEVLNSAAGFDENPEIVEEYSYLVARYLELLPLGLAQSGFFDSVVSFARVGVRASQREAQTGVMFSLTIFLMLGQPYQDDGKRVDMGLKVHPMARLSDEQQHFVVSRVREALSAQGAALVDALVKALTTGVPFYGFEGERASASTVIYGLLKCVPEALRSWLVAALEEVPAQISSAEDKQDFMQQLAEARDARDCTDAVYRLWRRAQHGLRRQKFHATMAPT